MTVALLDASVVVAAVLTPDGPAYEVLQELEQGVFEAVYCDLLLQEIKEALDQRKLREKYGYDDRHIRATLQILRRFGRQVQARHVARIAPDPDDDYLFAAALEGRARYLVTYDHELLSVDLRELRGRIRVVRPEHFLQIIRGSPRPARRRRGKRRPH